jgi:hypothetical protein
MTGSCHHAQIILFLIVHSFFSRIYLLYSCDSLWQFQICLYCTLVRSPPPSLSLHTLPVSLKAIARGFFVFCVGIWSPQTIFPHLHLLCSPSCLPLVSPPLCLFYSPFVIHL